MNTKIAPTDLSHRPPRSFHFRLGGFVILARMLDKGRATLADKNGEYKYNSGTDQHLVRFLGFDPETLLKELAAGKGDGEILAWVQSHSRSHERRGRSKPGPPIWKSGGPTVILRLLPGLPNTWGNTARLAKTSRPGSTPLNSTTTSVSEARHERLTTKKQLKPKKNKTYEQS